MTNITEFTTQELLDELRNRGVCTEINATLVSLWEAFDKLADPEDENGLWEHSKSLWDSVNDLSCLLEGGQDVASYEENQGFTFEGRK